MYKTEEERATARKRSLAKAREKRNQKVELFNGIYIIHYRAKGNLPERFPNKVYSLFSSQGLSKPIVAELTVKKADIYLKTEPTENLISCLENLI